MKGTRRYWRAQFEWLRENQEFYIRAANDFMSAQEFQTHRFYLRLAHKKAIQIRRLIRYYNAIKKGVR